MVSSENVCSLWFLHFTFNVLCDLIADVVDEHRKAPVDTSVNLAKRCGFNKEFKILYIDQEFLEQIIHGMADFMSVCLHA